MEFPHSFPRTRGSEQPAFSPLSPALERAQGALPRGDQGTCPFTNGEFLELVEQLNRLEVRAHRSPTPDTTMDIVAAQGWAGQVFHAHAPDGSKVFCDVLNYEL